MPFHPVYPG